MSKKCPPGVICLENATMVFLVIIIAVVFYFVYRSLNNDANDNYKPIEKIIINQEQSSPSGGFGFFTRPNYGSTNIGAVDTSYRQMGILTPLNGSGKILPLMGRPLFVNRYKWQYYTMSDQNNSVKLPIVRSGRSCTNEYGCDELYNSDTVYVEGYNEAFKITKYDNDTIKYIPFI